MKRKILAAGALALLLAVPIAGCSLSAPQGGQQKEEQLPEEEKEGQEEPGEKDASVLRTVMDASPEEYLKVPDPASLSFATAPQHQVSEKEVEEEYRYYRDNAVFLTAVNGRDTAQKGDVVNIDYKETAEGEEYPEADGFNYEIGGGMFSSSFDDQLVGMKTGETKTFSFSYPDDYYAENLRGRETTFEVTLNSIMAYDTPEFNDETIARIREICETIRVPVIASGNIRRMEDVKKLVYADCSQVVLDLNDESNRAILQEVSSSKTVK